MGFSKLLRDLYRESTLPKEGSSFATIDREELETHLAIAKYGRFELTDAMQPENNLLEVDVDNSECDIYPQQADFTFFGGLYRAVRYLEVEKAHFALDKSGTSGVFVTPRAAGGVRVDAFTDAADGCTVHCELRDAAGNVVAKAEAAAVEHTVFELNVEAYLFS